MKKKAQNKGGRPRKNKTAPPNPLIDGKKAVLSDLRVDPYSAHNELRMIVEIRYNTRPYNEKTGELGDLMQAMETREIFRKKRESHARIITGDADEYDKRKAGDEYVQNLSSMNTAELKEFFELVLNYKAQVEEKGSSHIHRAVKAFYDYDALTGKLPSKPQLKAFILANPEKYQVTIPADDKKAWTRIWADSGLYRLGAR